MAGASPLPGLEVSLQGTESSESRRGPREWEGKQEGLEWGSTHHRVTGLKHLAEQDAAHLLGEGFPERIKDTRVLGLEGFWALRAEMALLTSPPAACLSQGSVP